MNEDIDEISGEKPQLAELRERAVFRLMQAFAMSVKSAVRASAPALQRAKRKIENGTPKEQAVREALECPKCGGTGEVELLTSVEGCKTCAGTGLIPG